MFKKGDPILLVQSRLFENDHYRYFVGEVVGYDGGLVKVKGYRWIRERMGRKIVRKDEERVLGISVHSHLVQLFFLETKASINDLYFIWEDDSFCLKDSENDIILNLSDDFKNLLNYKL